ncbi:MAG: hypothetical protein ACREP6_04040 [Candidatus Binataceae bacterium]
MSISKRWPANTALSNDNPLKRERLAKQARRQFVQSLGWKENENNFSQDAGGFGHAKDWIGALVSIDSLEGLNTFMEVTVSLPCDQGPVKIGLPVQAELTVGNANLFIEKGSRAYKHLNSAS